MSYITVNPLQDNNEAKAEVLKQESTSSYPYLIKIKHIHDNVEEVFRIVKYFENVTLNGEIFTACDFNFTPPEQTQDGIKDANLSVSDIDQVWTERVRDAKPYDKIQVDFVACIIFDTNGNVNISEIEEFTFNCKSVEFNGITMNMSLEFDDRMNILIPCDIADSIKCAGCA